MKNTLFILVMIASLATLAQNPKGKSSVDLKDRHHPASEFTPQQRAELRTKQLTLELDLNMEQQEAIRDLIMGQVLIQKEIKDPKKEGEKLSSEELFQRKSRLLDEKIKFKNEMRSILNEKQFEKWVSKPEKRPHRKRRLLKRFKEPIKEN